MVHDPLPWPLAADHDDDVEAEETALVIEAGRTARLCAAGLVTGLVLTKLVDLFTAGPGLRVMVGL